MNVLSLKVRFNRTGHTCSCFYLLISGRMLKSRVLGQRLVESEETLALNLDFVPCHFHRLSLSSLTLISSLSSVSDTSSVPLQNLLASLSPEPLITLHPWLLPTQAGPRPAWQGHNLVPPASVPWGLNPWQAWGFGLRGIHAETILSMCPWSVY